MAALPPLHTLLAHYSTPHAFPARKQSERLCSASLSPVACSVPYINAAEHGSRKGVQTSIRRRRRNSRPFPSTRSGKREEEDAELSDRCSEWWRLQLPARRRWLRHGFLLAACCCSAWRPFTVSATARRTVQFFRVFSPVSFM